MAEPVIIPVTLECVDVDTTKLNFGDAQKAISKNLSGIKKVMQDAFSGIDASAVNKPIEKSMTSIKKSVQAAEDAQLRYNEALVRAGSSVAEYRNKAKQLDRDIAEKNEQLRQLEELQASREKWGISDTAFSNSYANTLNAEVESVRQALKKLTDERAKLNPLEFVKDAQPVYVEKIANAYGKVLTAQENVSKKLEDFNQTVQDNRASDEYNELVKEAEAYKKKLAELNEKSKEMEFKGATDNQWENMRKEVEWTSLKMDDVIKKMDKAVKNGKAFRFGEGPKGEFRNQINSFKMSAQNNAGYAAERAQKNQSPYTEDYQKSLEELDKLEKKVEAIREKSAKMIELGASKKQFESLTYDAESLDVKIDEVKNHLMNVVNEGGAFKFGNGDADAEISKIRDKAEGLQSSLGGVTFNAKKAQGGLTALSATNPKLAAVLGTAGKIAMVFGKVMKIAGKVGAAIVKGFTGAVKAIGKVASTIGKVVSAFGRVAKSVGGAVKNLFTLGKAGNKTSKDLNSRFKKLGKNILMFGLGFRTAYYAIKRLRNIFIEGFKVMGEQFDEVGQPMMRLMESFNRLKGSLATAFQPLVSVVMPILTQFMNYLSGLLESFGTFMAGLTGQSHIYKAVAKDIDSVSGAAKEANKQLGSYDKLEVIQNNDSAADKAGYSYEQQAVDANGVASQLANLVKDAWAKADFTEVGAFITTQLLGILDTIEQNILPKALDFVNKVLMSLNTFIDGFDQTAIGEKVGSIVNTIVEGLSWEQLGMAFANINNLVWGFFDGLVNKIDWVMLGTSVGNGIKSIFDNLDFNSWVGMISGLVNGISTAITNMLITMDFASIATTLGTAISNLFTSIDPVQIGAAINVLFKSAFTFIESFFATDAVGSVTGFLTTLLATIDWVGIGESLVSAVQTMLQSVGTALMGSDNPLLSAFGGIFGTMSKIMDALLPAIESILAAVWPIVESILPLITELLPPIAELISTAVTMVMPVLVSLFEAIMPILMKLAEILLPIIEDLLVSLQPIFDALTEAVLPVIVHLLDACMPLIEGLLGLVTDIVAPIMSLLGPLLEIVFKILDPIIIILEPILEILGILCDVIGDVLRPILDALTPVLDAVSSIFGLLSPIIELLIGPLNTVADVFKFVAGIIKGIVVPIIDILMGVIDFLANCIENMADGARYAFQSIVDAIKNVKDKIKQPFNAILGGIESFVNGLIQGINKAIKALNAMSFDVPDWVPLLGGKSFGFNIKEIKEVKIPRLAQGAVIPPNKEFLAMLGDQKHGTNIEAPLDTIKQALAEVMAEFGGGGNRQPIVLQVNGRTLAQVVWDEQEKRYKQTGKSMA